MRKLPMLLAPLFFLAFAACPAPIVTTPAPQCARLIPDSWREPIPGAALPDFAAIDAEPTEIDRLDAEARGWMQFGLAQTGQLTIANGRSADAIWIFENCEALQIEARPRRRFLGIF